MNATTNTATCIALFGSTVLLSTCRIDQHRIASVTLEPSTLTAGSDETWRVEVTIEPGGDGDPAYIILGCAAETPCPCFHAPDPPDECVSGFDNLWRFIWDSGSLGDREWGDFVYAAEGKNPFSADFPPGRYSLLVSALVSSYEGDTQTQIVEIEILPPP